MTPNAVEKIILRAGWVEVPHRTGGSQRKYVHPEKEGMITIPWHQGRNIPKGTLHNILKVAGLK